MTDEIKEILDRLDFNEWEVDLYKVPITWCELYDIRNYITNLQEENERLLKTQKMYEKKCNKIHDYILQNCEIIRHKDYDEIGKVNGRYILFLLNGDDE